MTKKIIVLFLLFSFIFSGVVIGKNSEEMKVEIEEVETENENNNTYDEIIKELTEELSNIEVNTIQQRYRNFKAVYGPHIKILHLNLENINNMISDSDSGFKKLDERLIISGRQGSIGSRYGTRLGTYRGSGQVSSINPGTEEYKKVKLTIDYSGLLYENGLIVWQQIDLAAGFSLGKGKIELNFLHDIPQDIGGGIDKGLQSNFTQDFVYFEPRLTIARKLWSLIGVDLTFSYLLVYDLGDDWDFEDYDVHGPAVQFKGPAVGLALSLGF